MTTNEDMIVSTGHEAIESLRADYRDYCNDSGMTFEEFAGDVLDVFTAAPDAVFSYDPQIRPESIRQLTDPGRDELPDDVMTTAEKVFASNGPDGGASDPADPMNIATDGLDTSGFTL